MQEFNHYIKVNRNAIPNYGDRYRHGEIISTSFVESAVNQVVSKRMVKLQQMRWTKPGAHLLLQVRTHVLNDELRSRFQTWYPTMKAALPPLCPGLVYDVNGKEYVVIACSGGGKQQTKSGDKYVAFGLPEAECNYGRNSLT